MATLLGTDWTAEMGAAFAGELLPATLHKAAVTLSETGAPVVAWTDHAGEGVRAKWRRETNLARGYPESTAKLVLLQASLAAAPATDDELTLAGERFRVVDVEQDAGGATWQVFGVRV